LGRRALKTKALKRQNHIFEKITTLENLQLADERARKGKSHQYGIRKFDRNREENLLQLQKMLIEKNYRTSEYDIFSIFEPKERQVYRLPYFPDRITHHAIMNVLEPIFLKVFTADTYSCIKGRGIHGAANNLKKALQDEENTQYCLKMDIVKFYPSVDHETLKNQLAKKFKDRELLWLLHEIIDSADGLPIGNYLSQYLANFYLSYFDHWLKEQMGVKYYFRYADDLVILSSNKNELHALLNTIKQYLNERLKLEVKDNYQIFPVASRGIDFVGYKFYHTHTLLRKSIKKRFAKAVSKKKDRATIAAYYGWAKHADTNHLLKKLLPNEQF
jgi:retron-type reverse transcriptase